HVNNGGCDTNATCSHSLSDYSVTCTCNTGFTGNGTVGNCQDSCHVNNGGCDTNATCSHSLPGYSVTCTCNAGFTGNGTVGNCQ
ncbi:unnamed protein product, partial [Didymodactylos carnosus]